MLNWKLRNREKYFVSNLLCNKYTNLEEQVFYENYEIVGNEDRIKM